LRRAAAQDQVERVLCHGDETLGGGAPFRHRLVRAVDHARLAGLIEMTETPRGHCAASRCFAGTPVRSARVAAVTSAWRIRLSPTRKAPTHATASIRPSLCVYAPC